MKKYFFWFAIIVMAISISAFSAKRSEKKVLENTYWFLMDASGTQVTTTQVTDPSALCPSVASSDCARKYNESQTEIVAGTRKVKAGQVNAPIDFRGKDE